MSSGVSAAEAGPESFTRVQQEVELLPEVSEIAPDTATPTEPVAVVLGEGALRGTLTDTANRSVIEPVSTEKPRGGRRHRGGGFNESRGGSGPGRATDVDPVKVYLDDIGGSPLLNKDDEVRLAKAIEAGMQARQQLSDTSPGAPKLSAAKRRDLQRAVRAGDIANEKFVESNLRLVVSIAKRYQGSNMPLLDIIQEGNLGLMHAVEKFDYRRGFKFSTYATWWIRQAITRGIADKKRLIRFPIGAVEDSERVGKARLAFEASHGRSPNLVELAEEAGMSVESTREVMEFPNDAMSLDEYLNSDSETTYAEMVADPAAESPADAAMWAVLPTVMEDFFKPLSDIERNVLRLRYGLDRGYGRTVEQVAQELGYSRTRISQIDARARAKLRHPASAIKVQAWLVD